ncbi:hypothetical protein [Marinobacter sp. MBR-105]|jgi:hypothetical protein
MKPLVLSLGLATSLVVGGCATGNGYPFEVNHPEGTVPTSTLHTSANVTVDVPNAAHQRLSVEVASLNGQGVDSGFPIVLPAGIHMISLRCKLYSSDRDADRHRLFYGQQQWAFKPHKTYHIRPTLEVDAYDNPVCSVTFRESI